MRYLKREAALLLAALCLLLCGCADQFGVTVFASTDRGGADAPAFAGGQEPAQAADPESAGDLEQAADPEEPPAEGNLFETLPRMYLFCSGAGGWSTELTLETDGSFTGLHSDADMGDSDPEKYPDGTRYICRFSGRFARPVKLDETTYSMALESLELEHPDDGAEEYADGVRYVYCGPYGLENTQELIVYLPETPAATLPEEVLWAAKGPYDWQPTAEGTLGLTILFNRAEGQGFVQYPLAQPETAEG